MEFNIGERVRIRAYAAMPEDVRNKGIAKSSGKDGEIVDKLWSAAEDRMVYRIMLDGAAIASRTLFQEGTFDRVSDLVKSSYVYDFDYADNVVIAIFSEVDHNGTKIELARGHGHIIHEGALGIAQAAAYALKRIWRDVDNDTRRDSET